MPADFSALLVDLWLGFLTLLAIAGAAWLLLGVFGDPR